MTRDSEAYFAAVRAAAFGAAFVREYDAHYSASNEPHARLRHVEALARVDIARVDDIAQGAEDAARHLRGAIGEGPDSERGGA